MGSNYSDASYYYDQIMQKLNEIGVGLAIISRKINRNFSTELFLRQFDILLQYSLLECAMDDRDVDVDELVIIKNITKHGDIIDLVNREYNADLTWNAFLANDILALKSFMDTIKDIVDEMAIDFCTFFGVFDANIPVDYLQLLIDDYGKIMLAVVCADGRVDQREKDRIPNNYMIKHVFGRIIQVINTVDKENAAKKNAAPTSGGRQSLKSMYENKLKKN